MINLSVFPNDRLLLCGERFQPVVFITSIHPPTPLSPPSPMLDGALYNLHMKSLKLKRRIAIGNISHISTSTLRDNFFIIHVPTEYDYVYLSEYKMEIMTLLQKLQQVATGMEMSLHVDNM